MNRQDVMNLELNQPVKYAGFNNLLFKGKDEKYVLLEDKKGDQKKIYIELFQKYGRVI